MAGQNEGRLAYADLLRVVAMVAVIVLHTTAGQLVEATVGSADWHVYNVYDSLTRWAVPLFVMLSGMFLLDPKKGLSWPDLFFRYILRMGVALLFWGVFYQALDHVLWGGVLTPQTLWGALLRFLKGEMKYHLWYVPMAIGLYLVTPLLRAFVRGAKRSDFHWFFFLAFLFSSLRPLLLHLRPSAAVPFWLDQLRLHLVLGYAVYFLAGYYLKNYTLGRVAEGIIYALGIAGAALTIGGTYALSSPVGRLDSILYSYFSPGVAAMAVAIFVLCRYVLGVSEERSRRQRLGGVAEVSFGVYLVHVTFLTLWQHLLKGWGLASLPIPGVVAVPATALLVLLPSVFTAWLLHKIPVVGRYLT